MFRVNEVNRPDPWSVTLILKDTTILNSLTIFMIDYRHDRYVSIKPSFFRRFYLFLNCSYVITFKASLIKVFIGTNIYFYHITDHLDLIVVLPDTQYQEIVLLLILIFPPANPLLQNIYGFSCNCAQG